jgi:glycine/D-amino acid oxidase-like deaminating enzyme
MTRRCDVAIVGGGIGGLTLAAGLLQRSVSVQVFEQDIELREGGRQVYAQNLQQPSGITAERIFRQLLSSDVGRMASCSGPIQSETGTGGRWERRT